MSEFRGIMGCLTILSIITIWSQIVHGSIQDFHQQHDSDYYQHREWYHGPQRRGFGPPNHRFGPPHHRPGPQHSWNGPHSNNHGYAYNRPRISWNEYQDYDDLSNRRTQDDYWVFLGSNDRFPPREQWTTTTTRRPVTQLPGAPSTISPEVRNCIRSCPVTPEYNPVCGTNNMTYNNLGRLQCAQFCGVEVEVQRSSPCSVPAPSPVPITSGTTVAPFTPPVPSTEAPAPGTTTEIEFTLDERIPENLN